MRSAIRVIQDVLVDKSRVLGPEAVKLADREIGTLACVDDFYDTLRADIAKVLPHVVAGVDKTAKIFGADSFELRVAKAVAALQPVETFRARPKTSRRCSIEKWARLLCWKRCVKPSGSFPRRKNADSLRIPRRVGGFSSATP